MLEDAETAVAEGHEAEPLPVCIEKDELAILFIRKLSCWVVRGRGGFD